jgi:hypothetical protein
MLKQSARLNVNRALKVMKMLSVILDTPCFKVTFFECLCVIRSYVVCTGGQSWEHLRS